MTLAKRLNDMERRLKELERWQASISDALAEEEDDGQAPELTLDGEAIGGERDQSVGLG